MYACQNLFFLHVLYRHRDKLIFNPTWVQVKYLFPEVFHLLYHELRLKIRQAN